MSDAADRILKRHATLYENNPLAQRRDDYIVARRVKELEAELEDVKESLEVARALNVALQREDRWHYGAEEQPEENKPVLTCYRNEEFPIWELTYWEMWPCWASVEKWEMWRYIDPPPEDVLARLRGDTYEH